MAEVALRFRLPNLRQLCGVADRRRQDHVRGMRPPHLGDGRHHLRQNPNSPPIWFAACWHFATGKDGISALSLKRTLEIGSYQTVWAILHRLRAGPARQGAPERQSGSG